MSVVVDVDVDLDGDDDVDVGVLRQGSLSARVAEGCVRIGVNDSGVEVHVVVAVNDHDHVADHVNVNANAKSAKPFSSRTVLISPVSAN